MGENGENGEISFAFKRKDLYDPELLPSHISFFLKKNLNKVCV